MNQNYQRRVLLVFLLVLLIALRLLFEALFTYVELILVWGILGGVSTILFNPYVNPNGLVYKFMFILKGVGLGLLLAVGMFAGRYLDSQLFNAKDLLKSLIVTIPNAIIITGGILYVSKRQLIKKVKLVSPDQLLLIDSTRIVTPDVTGQAGVWVLKQQDLVGYTNSVDDKLTYNLKNVQVKMAFSGRLKIPKGILINDKLLITFPKYWMKQINIVQERLKGSRIYDDPQKA